MLHFLQSKKKSYAFEILEIPRTFHGKNIAFIYLLNSLSNFPSNRSKCYFLETE